MLSQLIISLQRIIRFLKSLFFHIGYGLPKSSSETISYRYSVCLSCDSFDTKYSQCNECGCNISQKSELMNKLAWADQQCPLNKWSKTI
jgi:hypothetical protein